MTKQLCCTLTLAAVAMATLLLTATSAQATVLYEYNFTGGSLLNTGTATDGDLASFGVAPVAVGSKTDSNGVTLTDVYDYSSGTTTSYHFDNIADQTLSNFTISLWAWTDNPTSAPSIYSSVFMNDSIQLNNNNGEYRHFGSSLLFGTVLNDIWQHIAVTYDGTNTRLYLDGALTSTTAGADGNNNVFREIGIGTNRARNNDGHFLGMIDEVFVDDTALSDAQILAIYYSESIRKAVLPQTAKSV